MEKLNFVLADFSDAEVRELQRLLVKLNTKLLSTVEAEKVPAGADVSEV